MESKSQEPAKTKNNDFDYFFQVLILGDIGTGMRSVCSYYINGDYQAWIYKLGFEKKYVEYEGKVAQLQIWGRHGAERGAPLPRIYYKSLDGIFLMYDVTNCSSFESIEKYKSIIDECAPSYCQTVLFGHKADDEESRKVSFAAGSELASKLGLPFFEGSAKLGSGVYEAFDKLTALMVAKAIEDKRDTKIRFRKKDASKDEKRGCAVF